MCELTFKEKLELAKEKDISSVDLIIAELVEVMFYEFSLTYREYENVCELCREVVFNDDVYFKNYEVHEVVGAVWTIMIKGIDCESISVQDVINELNKEGEVC